MAEKIHGSDLPGASGVAPHVAPEGASPFPRWQAARGVLPTPASPTPAAPPADVSAVLMPAPGERRDEYLERMLGLRAQLDALIGAARRGLTAERARPELPAAERPRFEPAGPGRPPEAAVVPAKAPASWPAVDRRGTPSDRRAGPVDRRLGLADRRRRRPDTRLVRSERRADPADRRRGPVDRRHGGDRRRPSRSAGAASPLRFDAMTLFWVVQVVAWIAVAAIVLLYGLGG